MKDLRAYKKWAVVVAFALQASAVFSIGYLVGGFIGGFIAFGILVPLWFLLIGLFWEDD